MSNQSPWLGRPKPLQDETFSSWFRRTGTANGLSAREMYRAILPGAQLYSYDLDRHACSSLLERLSARTNVPHERLVTMTLMRWDGVVTEAAENRSRALWLPPVGRSGNTRHFGQQICPACLREDLMPYYRGQWRLALMTSCHIHTLLLLDRCPSCGEAIQVLKSDECQNTHSSCWRCGIDFRSSPTTQAEYPSTVRVFNKFITDNWAPIGEYGSVHTLIYFRMLHLLVRFLISGQHSQKLRQACAQNFNATRLTGANIPRLKQAERLNPRARNLILAIAERLLRDWPNTFIGICVSAGLSSRELLKGNQIYPFAFEDAIRKGLSSNHESASADEVASAAAILRRRGSPPTRHSLEQVLGKKFQAAPEVVAAGRDCLPYGTHRYWKLDGISPDVRLAAKLAAKRSGENVGTWVENTLRRVLTENTTGC